MNVVRTSDERAPRSRIPVWCEIVCRSCAHSHDGQFTSGQIPKRAMVKEARGDGWIFKYNEAFCSPKCVNKYENEKRQEHQHAR
jgi:hypothetical protein